MKFEAREMKEEASHVQITCAETGDIIAMAIEQCGFKMFQQVHGCSMLWPKGSTPWAEA